MRRYRHLIAPLILLLGAVMAFWPQARGQSTAPVVVVPVTGPIGPASVEFIQQGLAEAQMRGARAVVLRLDTPGGLVSSMRTIIQDILAAEIPVIGFVGPSGARAASAGTYILYATHVAAMAPGTNLGAATPVQMGGSNPLPGGGQDGDADGGDSGSEDGDESGSESTSEDAAPTDALELKSLNDAVAYIRALAELRGRNADWAERAVRAAASLSANAALEENVIEFVAQDIADVLRQADGRRVQIDGDLVTLNLDGAPVEIIEPDWRIELLSILTNPNVAYILMLVGIYGLILEFYNPGIIFSGVIGAICLLLALYAFQALPVNYAGLALIVLGIALMIGEALTPSFGVFGVGGLVAFVLGSIFLMDSDVPGFAVATELIAGIAIGAGGLLLFTVVWLTRSQQRNVVSGQEALIGQEAVVLNWQEDHGTVRLAGEIWQARGAGALKRDDRVRVEQLDGLTVEVSPKKR